MTHGARYGVQHRVAKRENSPFFQLNSSMSQIIVQLFITTLTMRKEIKGSTKRRLNQMFKGFDILEGRPAIQKWFGAMDEYLHRTQNVRRVTNILGLVQQPCL